MRIDTARIRRFWRRITSTAYTRALELELARSHAEHSRLRQENRALLNSILGIAGVPPVYSVSAEDPRSLLSPRAGPEALASTTSVDKNRPPRTAVTGPVSPSAVDVSAVTGSQTGTPARRGKNPVPAAPLRRRSWHQINRTLELKAARKSSQECTED
jgi:hypothetical protein